MNIILTVISLVSLIILGYNILFINSLLLGVIIAPIYLFIVSLLCGNVLFFKESQRFRIFYGFVVFFCLLVILGTIAYWIHDLSNLPILIILFLLTILLIFLNWRRRPLLSLAGIKLKERITELNLGVLDFLFLSMVGLSFYFLFAARTGESIPPFWNLVSSWFFPCIILATAALVIKIWHGKSPSGLLLFYIILLILIPATGFLVVLHQAYGGLKGSNGLAMDHMISKFGVFSVDPALGERAQSIVGKNILEIGQPIGNCFLIKLLQIPLVPPQRFALFFVPILFTLTVVLAAFDLMRSLAPNQKRLALLCSLSFLAVPYNMFLFTPSGKNETFALGLLMVSVMLWVRFLQGQRFRWASFIAPVILLAATLLIHQFVGLFALFLAVSVLSLFLLKPFQGGLPRLSSWLALTIGLIFVWVYGYPHLDSLVGSIIGSHPTAPLDIYQFTLSKFINTIAPPLWSGEGLGIFQGIFYTFINNSVYVTYALIVLGAIAAFRYRLNKNWLAISLSLVVLAFLYFGIVANLNQFLNTARSESFRFFSYLNLIAFPLMGVGLYWLASYIVESMIWIYTKSKEKEKFISLKPLQLAICGLLLASLFTSSVYAGYPGENCVGLYRYPKGQIRFVSDYDVSALNFIKAAEQGKRDYFIVCDDITTAAGLANMGYQVISTPEGPVSIFSFLAGPFWEAAETYWLAFDQPLKYLIEGTDYTSSLADKTYLVFTYRLGVEKLRSLVNIYSDYLGEPVYAVEDKVYVFSYDAEGQLTLFDDEPTKDGFWRLQLIGKGGLTFNISDNTEVKKRGSSSLEVMISPGEYERATLRHVWDEPVDFGEASYLMLFVNGANTGIPYDMIFRGATKDPMGDYFSYRITDDFKGWKQLVIPLESFKVGGTPSWSAIKEMLIIFRAGGSPAEIYFDQISAVKELPLQLLCEESVINLP